MLRSDRGAHKQGAGSYFRILGAGFQGGGLPRRRDASLVLQAAQPLSVRQSSGLRNYRKNATGQYAGWHSNAQLLGKLLPGDRMWMVTSGKALRQEAEQAGFLVAVWQVAEALENPGDDPTYPKDRYRYRVVPNEGESITLNEPVPVDHILRPARGRQGRVHRTVLAGTTKDWMNQPSGSCVWPRGRIWQSSG